MTFSTFASPGVSLQGGGGSGGGGGGTPGGSNTQIQYNSSGTFAGASGLTTTTGTELTIASGTKTADAPVLNMSQTWNNAAVTFTGLKFNATDTASNAASLLLDLQTGGTSRFNLTKAGTLTFAGNLQIANNAVYIEGTAVGTVRVPGIGGYYGFTTNTASTSASTIDTFVTRRAAANLRFGAADAAAPVAQTLSVQSVVAGTSNTAGANLTITGSQGTGTGEGGSIIFQVAPAGSTGTAQNALSAALTITPVGGASPLFTVPNFSRFVTNNLAFTENSGYYRAMIISGGAPEYRIAAGGAFSFAADAAATTSPDVLLRRDAANTLALRNGASAQTFRVYNTYTSDTNYESGRLQWSGNEFRIGPETVGGSVRSMGLYSGGTRYQIIGGNFNQFDQPLYMNGANIATDTSTGFKIGTGTTQKIGFWNATPIVQPTTAVAAATVAATGVGDVVAASTTFDGYTIPQIVKALRNAGLLA